MMTSRMYLRSSARILALMSATLIFPAAYADESASCAVAQVKEESGQPMALWQHIFADGVHDLVMAPSSNASASDIKRITFGGSTEDGCHYSALAIARGVGWGWHLAWGNSKGLYYARMDGVAWVSSPPKRLAEAGATMVELQTTGEQVALTWQAASGQQYRAISADEGRSWDAAQKLF